MTITVTDERSLVEQIVTGVSRAIDDRHLRPGTRLPSIRAFAEQHRVSRFTVVEAYDRLVAMGYLYSRRGAGFYAQSPNPMAASWTRNSHPSQNDQLVYLIRRAVEAPETALRPGGGWLPPDWLDSRSVRQSLNVQARKTGPHLVLYGNPYGYQPLREHLCILLADIGLAVRAPQVMLTAGASQALDCVIRLMLRPGDTALVDEPGYYNLFGILRIHGVNVVGVPRNADGPDIEALEALIVQHRPKLYFVQTAVQNPTGTTMLPHVAFRLLQIAERFDLTIVEDDVFCDLQSNPTPRLATLDQLRRVIYVRSFSKALSSALRVGFIAARPETIDNLADIKMLTSITSSEVVERLVHSVLIDGQYRKHISRLHARLEEARSNVFRLFERIGVELFAEPTDGMYVWARFPRIPDSLALAQRAAREDIVLAPGTVFHPQFKTSPWLRFNIANCDDPRVQRWFERVSAGCDGC